MQQRRSKTEKLFVYGTLRYKKYQREAIGRVCEGKKANALECKKFILGRGKENFPVMVRSNNSVVHGLVLDVTSEELRAFDEYENSIYERQRVRLQDGSSAWAYVYVEK